MKMKKPILLFAALSFVMSIAGDCSRLFAFELTPFVKLGTINWREKNINEGHKFLQAAGLKMKSEFDDFKGIVGAEVWRMGEPLDEDRELPSKGHSFCAEIEYNKQIDDHLIVYPYAGAGFERFSRVDEGNIKYHESWSSLSYFSLALGGGARYKIAYAKAGARFPFYGRTNNNLEPKAKPGFDFEIGIRWRGLTLGWFYKRIGFDEFGPETVRQPDFEFNRYGAIIKYSF
jgi:hypothetical protein